jgi:hypothetical protein
VTSPPPCRDPAEGQIGRDHGPVPLLGGAGQGVCRFQAAPQSIETVDPEGDDEFVLVPEPAIQRHRAVADLGREPPHGETVTPVPNEKPGGDIEESASDGFALSVCKARRHRKSTSRRNIVSQTAVLACLQARTGLVVRVFYRSFDHAGVPAWRFVFRDAPTTHNSLDAEAHSHRNSHIRYARRNRCRQLAAG